MDTNDKVRWLVAMLVFAIGMGWVLSGDSLYYDKVEITPAVDAVYELVPLTPTQMFGRLLCTVAVSALIALVIGSIAIRDN